MTDPRAQRFEVLYRRHHGDVLRFLARRIEAAAAEELCAETFAIAWRQLDRIPGREPLPWLYVTARHCLANHRRAVARDADKAGRAATAAAGRDPAEALAGRDAVLRAFTGLSERDREALRLVAWDGLSLAAAARVAGVPRPAFAMRVSRARRRLAERLAAEEAPEPFNSLVNLEPNA